jgi:hypothetical protein
MAVEIVKVGRFRTTPDNAVATLSGGTLIACVYAAPAVNCFAYRFGARMGRSGASTPDVRMVAYALTTGGNPSTRKGYSGTVNPSTQMTTDSSSGAFYESDVAATNDDETLNTAFRMYAGTRYALGTLSTGATLNHGMATAASISESNETFYTRTGLSQPPPDPIGSYTLSTQGHLTLWIYAHTNEAPRVPVNRTPSGSISSTTPQLEGDFRDRNGTWGPANDGYDDGDRMSAYRVQVRRVSDLATMWAPSAFTATALERSADRFSVAYAGTALVRGTAYEWRCQVRDDFNEWGDWSDWLTFTPANLGLVTLAGDPSGKVDNTFPDLDFTWTHQTGLSTNAIEARIYQGASIVRSSATTAKTVASGASATATWTELGLGAVLPTGIAYTYRIRGRDTNNAWSDWSAARSFSVDAPPSIPDGLSPANGEIVTSYPLLTFQMTDQDDDTSTGLVGKVRIKNSAGAVLFTRDATLNTITGFWEYQTTGTDLVTFADYRWDAYGYDGFLYSGNKSVEASATKSDEEQFTFADGPTVTITSPADASTVTSSTPTVTWTASAQNRYRLTVYLAGTNTDKYTRGPLVSAATSWQIPAGYLRNNTAYDIELWVEDSGLLTGTSQRVTVTTDFTGPDAATGVSAVPVSIGNDPFPTAITVQWDATTEPGGTFVGTYVYRDDIEGFPYRIFTSTETTSFTDFFPRSGVEYVYTVRHVGQRDLDQVESDAVSASASVDLAGVVLCAANNPATYRAVLDDNLLRDISRTRDEQMYFVGANAKPVTYRSPTSYLTVTGEYRIVPPADAVDKRAAITQRTEDVLTLEEQDDVVCYRDDRGRLLFGRIVDFMFNEHRLYPIFTFGVREETFVLHEVP